MHENVCLVKMRLLTSFLCCTFLKDNLVFIASFSFRTGAHVPVPVRSAVAGSGGARPRPHLENVLHALIDELHVDDVQQGGCRQHLPPETTWRRVRPRKSCLPCALAGSQVCKMSAALLASGPAGSELTAGGREGDRRGQASALNDPRERLVKMHPEAGQTPAKHAQIRARGEPRASSKAGGITLTFKCKNKSKLHSAKPLCLESCFPNHVKLFPLSR